MNFDRLSSDQLREFLTLNGIDVSQMLHEISLADGAQELFNHLRQQNATTFTEPVIDLYIATQLKNLPAPFYTREDILNADDRTIAQFASIMGLPIDTNTRTRIIRILDFMNLILPINLDQLISDFSNVEFYYEIPVTEKVRKEATIDSLYRHVIEEFANLPEGVLYILDPVGFEVRREGSKQYLVVSFKIELEDEVYERISDFDILATEENMRRVFGSDKIIVPKSFVDHVKVGEEYDDYQVTFKLTRIETPDSAIHPRVLPVSGPIEPARIKYGDKRMKEYIRPK